MMIQQNLVALSPEQVGCAHRHELPTDLSYTSINLKSSSQRTKFSRCSLSRVDMTESFWSERLTYDLGLINTAELKSTDHGHPPACFSIQSRFSIQQVLCLRSNAVTAGRHVTDSEILKLRPCKARRANTISRFRSLVSWGATVVGCLFSKRCSKTSRPHFCSWFVPLNSNLGRVR